MPPISPPSGGAVATSRMTPFGSAPLHRISSAHETPSSRSGFGGCDTVVYGWWGIDHAGWNNDCAPHCPPAVDARSHIHCGNRRSGSGVLANEAKPRTAGRDRAREPHTQSKG